MNQPTPLNLRELLHLSLFPTLLATYKELSDEELFNLTETTAQNYIEHFHPDYDQGVPTLSFEPSEDDIYEDDGDDNLGFIPAIDESLIR